MYAQMAFVTSVRGRLFLPPHTVARSELRVFGAKMPTPFFFIAKAFFLPFAAFAFLPAAFFSAVIFLSAALVIVVFVVVVVGTVVLVVVVIVSERWRSTLEP